VSFNKAPYLQPSGLCDFDRSPQIRKKAAELIRGAGNRQEKFQRIFAFVKELPYGLEDWDLKASQILRKGWGMCSGKTNLLIAMLRSSGIPARYRIYQIKADTLLWKNAGNNNAAAERMSELGELRDHVDCEVWLGKWMDCDPGRDTAMEKGILRLGGSLERQKVTDQQGKVRYVRLAVFDRWVEERQARRKFRSDRKAVFTEINQGFEKLRDLGRA
jgi:transglutaminase-like putative cysteine protease